MTSKSFLVGLAMLLCGCGGSSSGVSSDPSIVGTWGVTTTTAQGANSRTDETYMVFGADKVVRNFSRSALKAGNITASTSRCGSGTYVFANGVLSTTIQEKSTQPQPGGTPTTITRTVTSSAKVEFIDASLRLTTDMDGSSNVAVYTQGTLPDGLEASCPK